MTATTHKKLQPQLTVEYLAVESHVSIREVTELCAVEAALLGLGARVTEFVPVLALRRVRRALRRRGAVLALPK